MKTPFSKGHTLLCLCLIGVLATSALLSNHSTQSKFVWEEQISFDLTIAGSADPAMLEESAAPQDIPAAEPAPAPVEPEVPEPAPAPAETDEPEASEPAPAPTETDEPEASEPTSAPMETVEPSESTSPAASTESETPAASEQHS